MKRFSSFFILVFIFLISFEAVNAQRIRIRSHPKGYNNWQGQEVISNASEQEEGEPWIVFSDRANNRTYTSSLGGVVHGTVGFLDKFYVVDEQNGFLHIYSDDKADEEFLSQGAVDMGWISKDNLILSRKCLYNQNDIQRKAMLINTLDAVKMKYEPGKSNRIRFFRSPRLPDTDVSDFECGLFNIFFIYKSFPPNSARPTSFLLGSNALIDLNNADHVIRGWVDANRLISWDHRIAVLPNTTDPSIFERKSKGIRATVFLNEPGADGYRDGFIGSVSNQVLWNDDKYLKQDEYTGYYMRFPVLSNKMEISDKQGVMRLGVMGSVETGAGESISKVKWERVREEVNTQRAESRNINILFVIDGTRSMEPYFSKVADAVINSMNELQGITLNSYKFAAVIYRDMKDGPKYLTESKLLTANVNELASWLRTRKAFDTLDTDAPEAVFYGLKYAITRCNLPPHQTNYLILIGDAANHQRNDETQVRMDSIVELMDMGNYNFFAYQVNNKGGDAYYRFGKEAKQILLQIALKQFPRNLKVARELNMEIAPPELVEDLKARRTILKNPSRYGAVLIPYFNQPMSPEVLKREIVRSVQSIDDSTNIILEAAQKLFERGEDIKEVITETVQKSTEGGTTDERVGRFGAAFLTHLTQIGLSPETVRLLKEDRVQLYEEGYSSMFVKGLTDSPWQYDLFLTFDEMTDLNDQIKKLQNVRTASEKRLRFRETWMQILKEHIGESKTNAELENMSIEEAEKLLFGLPGTSDFLKLRIGQIMDESVLSNAKLAQWINSIYKKGEELIRIQQVTNSNYEKHSFMSNDRRYFWIPQRLLP